MPEELEGWVEADGTEYVLNSKGGYDVIYPKKPAKKSRKAKKE